MRMNATTGTIRPAQRSTGSGEAERSGRAIEEAAGRARGETRALNPTAVPDGATTTGTTTSRVDPATSHRSPSAATTGQTTAAKRTSTARKGPRSRRDSRRPSTPRPMAQAAAAARRQERERQPRHWFADQLLLTLSGRRPVHTLLGHTLPDVYDRLAELAPLAPLRPADPRGHTPVVRGCGQYQPRQGVIEAFARIASGDRLRALAFRLELGTDGRWRCAAVELGPC